MTYLLLFVVAVTHIYMNYRIGFLSTVSDKERLQHFLWVSFITALATALLTSLIWSIAPIWGSHAKMLNFKLLFVFTPAYFFIGIITIYIGAFFKKLLK